MTRCHYLTARCPSGCECWLHPATVRSHLARCRGRAWVHDVPETVLVTGADASQLAEVLPARLIGLPHSGGGPSLYLRGERAITVASPLPGVAPRRWLRVALAAHIDRGGAGLLATLDPAVFKQREAELEDSEPLVVCGDCGETLEQRGLVVHQARSTRCRWAHAATEVRHLWDEGCRDPYSLPGGTPVSWTELNRTVRWRKRIRTVRFPNWTAVLLTPPPRW